MKQTLQVFSLVVLVILEYEYLYQEDTTTSSNLDTGNLPGLDQTLQ